MRKRDFNTYTTIRISKMSIGIRIRQKPYYQKERNTEKNKDETEERDE